MNCKCNHDCNEGRDCPNQIEYAGPEPLEYAAGLVTAIVLLLILGVSFSPEIAAIIYAYTK
jgi:hypothetical protein